MNAYLGVAGLALIAIGIGPATAGDMQFACARNNAVRTVSVINQPASGRACEVQYEKTSLSEPAQVLWHAASDASFCSKQAQALVERLGDAGWSCTASSVTMAAATDESTKPAGKAAAIASTAAPTVPEPLSAAMRVSEPAPQGVTAAFAKPAHSSVNGVRDEETGDRPPIDPDTPAASRGVPSSDGLSLRPTIH